MNESSNILLRLFGLAWHHGYVFFTKTRSLIPIVLWISVLYLCFDIDVPPTYAMQGYVSTTPWFFFIIVWLSYMFLSGFNIVEERILILQINSRFLHALSKILFLVALSLVLSLFGCIFPVVVNTISTIRGLSSIPNGIHLMDLFGGFFLNLIIGVLGVSLAYLFQPNPSKHRNDFMSLMLFVFSILAIAKNQIFDLQAPFNYLLFVFTPLFEIIGLFNGKNTFIVADLMSAATYGGIYCLISMILGYCLYNKRIYSPLIAQYKKE